jgi:hypothetical protein
MRRMRLRRENGASLSREWRCQSNYGASGGTASTAWALLAKLCGFGWYSPVVALSRLYFGSSDNAL